MEVWHWQSDILQKQRRVKYHKTSGYLLKLKRYCVVVVWRQVNEQRDRKLEGKIDLEGENKMADILGKIIVYVGSGGASTDIDDLKNVVERTKIAMQVAEGTSKFLEILPDARRKFGEIAGKLDDISKGLGKLKKAIKAVLLIRNIYQAIKVLKNDRIFTEDPQKAADAFDSLFRNFGGLCAYLPPPANQWESFFTGFNLIGNIQRNILSPYHKKLGDIKNAGEGNYNY